MRPTRAHSPLCRRVSYCPRLCGADAVVMEVQVMTDVLVVGAGPTGLMLANQLGRRGVRVTIIDRHSGPARESRAMAVHARTLEIYSKLGLVERALELGTPGYGANMWAGGRLKARIPLKDMGKDMSPFPYVLMLGQDDNERIMGEHLRRWGLSVQWNTELVALDQQADHVTATVKDLDGRTRTITAAYVAGCDGSRSAVRTLCGIAFPGAPYEHAFFVADTEATGPMVANELNVFLWRSGFHLYFPMKGTNRWRVIGILPNELAGRDGVTFEDLVPALLQVGGTGLSFTACHWFSTYRIHHRCTERFRDRRCFLLGDAAHIHSPMGGQGMNTGLQDAYNLAWKLALVITNRASEGLLDTYEAERRPFAQQLLATTDRAFRARRVRGLVRRHASHPHRPARGGHRDEPQTGTKGGVPDALPDWDSLPRERPLAGPWDAGRERAACRRSLSLASSEVQAAGATRGSVPEAR